MMYRVNNYDWSGTAAIVARCKTIFDAFQVLKFTHGYMKSELVDMTTGELLYVREDGKVTVNIFDIGDE